MEVAWHLDKPTNIMREKFVIYNPFCKFVPFIDLATVDAYAPLAILCDSFNHRSVWDSP